MLYILAAWTGYRREELASLTLRSFNFDSDPPTVSVKASYSKRRRNDVVPLHAAVVERLKSWLAEKGTLNSDKPLFDLRTKSGGLRRTSKMMRLDLERVGIPYCDEDGLYADFHANRHSFISNLAKAGIARKIAQTIARHSDVNLTLNVYSHVGIRDQAAAIGSLMGPPQISKPEPADESSRITPQRDESFAQGFAQTPDSDGHAMAPGGTEANQGLRNQEAQKPLQEQGLVSICHQLSPDGTSSGGGTRTPDTRIMIPLL